ncbi:MAG: transporter substrate-binding domain-containing protein [Desulfobacter sp.]|nr:MAG: transporter substrate-binding domain-containing protein [Desulfobacter sp.]
MDQSSYQMVDISYTIGIIFPSKKMVGFLLFCFITIIGSPNLWCMNKHSIKLGAFKYPPFYLEEEGKICGIAVEIIDELFGRLSIETDVTLYPLKRALGYAKEGKIDAIMILIKTTERSEYIQYTIPIMKVRGLIWSAVDRKGGILHFSSLKDLKSYKIGATIGYSYGQKFDDLLKSMKVNRVATDYQNYKKLMAHRIDIFPGNEIVAKGLFKKHPELRGKFRHSDQSFMEWVLHMGVSKKSAFIQTLPCINTVLKDLKEEGFIQETIRKYTE